MAGRGWWKDTGMIVGAVTAFMMVSAYAAWPWWEFAFLSDGSPVSWLSGALLAANAAIALNLTVTGSLPSRLGYALAAALAALAVDEQFQLHERLQESAEFGALGHLPTWLVGIGGLAFLVALLRTIKPRAGQGRSRRLSRSESSPCGWTSESRRRRSRDSKRPTRFWRRACFSAGYSRYRKLRCNRLPD